MHIHIPIFTNWLIHIVYYVCVIIENAKENIKWGDDDEQN